MSSRLIVVFQRLWPWTRNIQIYLYLNQNTQEAPKWGPKGAPVGPGTEVTGGGAAIKKTLENVTFGGFWGVGHTWATGVALEQILGVHFGTVLGGPWGLYQDLPGGHFESLGPAFWIPCGAISRVLCSDSESML